MPTKTTYSIARTRSGMTCDRPRSRYAAESIRCKHILAVQSVGLIRG
jgi:hypothetical protein